MPNNQQGDQQPASKQQPGGKVQGEGDYESAERFNQSEREFVKRHGSPRQPEIDAEAEEELQAAEAAARERADEKERDHDAIDEQLLRDRMQPDTQRADRR